MKDKITVYSVIELEFYCKKNICISIRYTVSGNFIFIVYNI